jgi:hypothetical protein
MDLGFVIKHRLKELGLKRRGLAVAAQVTESYIHLPITGGEEGASHRRPDGRVYEDGRLREAPQR